MAAIGTAGSDLADTLVEDRSLRLLPTHEFGPRQPGQGRAPIDDREIVIAKAHGNRRSLSGIGGGHMGLFSKWSRM
ncbi:MULTISPECIES: hypothetical protein [Rhizobium]|uniref:hypothetical protein n=1 Tax=Rhizobium TaxID=379 RepID=UPI000462842B|nr:MULTISPECIES: hypothetical protein [Rhizobium]MCS0463522.1 hypothetical protein [Rhizobium favelukesii]UFS84719.1 hypothetical protein LPB79_33305 [Rhizobium sp. T136]